MQFDALEKLRRAVRDIKKYHSKSLGNYFVAANDAGFSHLLARKNQGRASRASTATCVVSLIATGAWLNEKDPDGKLWSEQTKSLLEGFSELPPEQWDSAKLGKGNPFTVAFMLEAIKALYGVLISGASAEGMDEILKDKVKSRIGAAENILIEQLLADAVASSTGGRNEQQYSVRYAANVNYYPPTAFLTQLVVRAILGPKDACGTRVVGTLSQEWTQELVEGVKLWSRSQVEREIVLITAQSKVQDPLALSYALTTFLTLLTLEQNHPTPDDTTLVKRALDSFFNAQLKDGTWPRSRPLHHYQEFGNAYCFDYEALVQLLQVDYPPLKLFLIERLEHLSRSIASLEQDAIRVGDAPAWSSGHHPHLHDAESWSTASVFHCLHALDRLVAEAIRRTTFEHLGAQYTEPDDSEESLIARGEFKPDFFLDSEFRFGGETLSLVQTIESEFLAPLRKGLYRVVRGESLRDTAISIILYGPPGTSKTELAKLIAKELGWPMLGIDPSHLFKGGLDQIQFETNQIFNMLSALERTVVFFDEFDELVRDRDSHRADLTSRFLTTAMLPKLTRIAEERKTVFILATNHIESFDFAISRPGRFDLIVPVMPPTFAEKCKKWKIIAGLSNDVLGSPVDGVNIKEVLGALTYKETQVLAATLEGTKTDVDRIKAIGAAWGRAAMSTKVESRQQGESAKLLIQAYEEYNQQFSRTKYA